jgi:hypothetical protein
MPRKIGAPKSVPPRGTSSVPPLRITVASPPPPAITVLRPSLYIVLIAVRPAEVLLAPLDTFAVRRALRPGPHRHAVCSSRKKPVSFG